MPGNEVNKMALFRDVKRASEIHFCNRGTSMKATNVQDAILELARLLNLAEAETADVYIVAYGNVGCTFNYYDINNVLHAVEVAGYSEESFKVKAGTMMRVVLSEETQVEFRDGNDEPTPEYTSEGIEYTVPLEAGTDVYRIALR